MKAIFRKRITGLALAVVMPLGFGGLAQAEESRFALVIGEDAYTEGALPTVSNDAALVVDTLQNAGFEVTGQRNLDQPALRAAMRDFIAKAREAGPDAVVAFYFSGYGLQYAGENYLVPYGAKIDRDTDVPLEAVRVDDFIHALGNLKVKARIVMLDAARNAPFAKSGAPLAGGLAMMEAPEGTLVSFNAAPGSVAPDAKEGDQYGAYAQSFGELAREGAPALDYLFARLRVRASELSSGAVIPWHVSKVSASFAFFQPTTKSADVAADSAADTGTDTGTDAAGAAATPEPTVTLASGSKVDLLGSVPVGNEMTVDEAYAIALARDTIPDYEAFLAAWPDDPLAERVKALLAARREATTWLETRKQDTTRAYWSYLKRYPKGPHAEDARRRLARLAAAYEPPPTFEEVTYHVAPPRPYEIIYVERPVYIFYDPIWVAPPKPIKIVNVPIWTPPPPPPPAWDAPFVLPLFLKQQQKPLWKPPVYVKLPQQPIIQNQIPLNQILKPQPIQLGSKPIFQTSKLPQVIPQGPLGNLPGGPITIPGKPFDPNKGPFGQGGNGGPFGISGKPPILDPNKGPFGPVGNLGNNGKPPVVDPSKGPFGNGNTGINGGLNNGKPPILDPNKGPLGPVGNLGNNGKPPVVDPSKGPFGNGNTGINGGLNNGKPPILDPNKGPLGPVGNLGNNGQPPVVDPGKGPFGNGNTGINGGLNNGKPPILDPNKGPLGPVGNLGNNGKPPVVDPSKGPFGNGNTGINGGLNNGKPPILDPNKGPFGPVGNLGNNGKPPVVDPGKGPFGNGNTGINGGLNNGKPPILDPNKGPFGNGNAGIGGGLNNGGRPFDPNNKGPIGPVGNLGNNGKPPILVNPNKGPFGNGNSGIGGSFGNGNRPPVFNQQSKPVLVPTRLPQQVQQVQRPPQFQQQVRPFNRPVCAFGQPCR